MNLTRRRFQRERIRWREKQISLRRKKERKTWSRLLDWWNRRQFYTFHTTEVITREEALPPREEQNVQESEQEYEWNNESESDFDIDDEVSIGSSQMDLEKELMDPLETIDEGSPLDDTMDTLETIDEEFPMDESPRLGSKPKIPFELQQASPAQAASSSTPAPQTTINRKGTVESISGSLESMDSIAESNWDPDDDASNVTPLVKNTRSPNDVFFVEHVKFLQVQTQPRRVEQVYTESTLTIRSTHNTN